MSRNFDKNLFFKNVNYLIQESGKKIGEIEKASGVSSGYISRTIKEENSKPGIDFIMNISDSLNVSIDSILNDDLGSLSVNDKYLISFLDKLKKDTDKNELYWLTDDYRELNEHITSTYEFDHPLFNCELKRNDPYSEARPEYSISLKTEVTDSQHARLSDDVYYLRLKNNTILYLVSIIFLADEDDSIPLFATEMWMKPMNNDVVHLCDSFNDKALSRHMEFLYHSIKEYLKHPRLDEGVQYIIDSYMNDDIEDDVPKDDLPFY